MQSNSDDSPCSLKSGSGGRTPFMSSKSQPKSALEHLTSGAFSGTFRVDLLRRFRGD